MLPFSLYGLIRRRGIISHKSLLPVFSILVLFLYRALFNDNLFYNCGYSKYRMNCRGRTYIGDMSLQLSLTKLYSSELCV